MYHLSYMSASSVNRDLVSAAAAAFARYGWHGATLARIADEAGTTRVTLHRKGITKDRLLAALVTDGTQAYALAMLPALTGTGSGGDRLAVALEALCEQTEAHMGLLLALQAQTDAVFHEPADEPLTRSVFTDPLVRLLQDGIADGSVQVDDPVETATVLFNLVGWTYLHLRTGHSWPPERASEAVRRIALSGVTS